ncbi:MAG: IS21 family transposase, partial [Candidatus Eremiobacteraeota bacterium]|nr:IS21 family transposase [Candidatus Eremiobacteraeota bacterium]
MEISVLQRQGHGIREIARQSGASRNTVRSVLRKNHDGVYGPRKPRATKLDPYAGYIRERLKQAGNVRLSAMVVLREIRGLGYAGGISQLKEFLRTVRPERPPEPIVRFETEPGLQLQIDFVDFRRGLSPLRAFTAELGYSRYSYVEFTDNERAETLIACLERALQF